MWNLQRAINELVTPRDLGPNKLVPRRRQRPIDPAVEARADRRREALEPGAAEIFDRVHAEAGKQLRLLRVGKAG